MVAYFHSIFNMKLNNFPIDEFSPNMKKQTNNSSIHPTELTFNYFFYYHEYRLQRKTFEIFKTINLIAHFFVRVFSPPSLILLLMRMKYNQLSTSKLL